MDRRPTARCPSCGAAAPEGARFCPACGARIEAVLTESDKRVESMVRQYGEACCISTAAKIIHASRDKICSMMTDGRLSPACEGTRVDVRSIARYIEAPAAAEDAGRIERAKRRNRSEWAV